MSILKMNKKINSKQKGKRGELEWSKLCREYGFDVHRSQQYCGKTGNASDCVGLPGIHQEIKCVEKLNINIAMQQAISDAIANKKEKLIPIVAHKKNRREWLVTMRADDWFKLYNAHIAIIKDF